MGIRKNQATLTATEKRHFVNAVLELKRRGRYDQLVVTHNRFVLSDVDDGRRTAHRSPSFLPWHRRFLLDFERALQAINPAVSLPYWDSSVATSPTSSLWAPDFLGGNGRRSDGRVMTGPFAYSTGAWTLNVRTDSRPFLQRAFGAGGRLPTPSEVRSALAQTRYDVAPWNSASSTGFRNFLEGWRGPNVHNRVHVWVGGNMLTGMSPNDPVFWLHHCYIDKLWADWQRLHPGVGYAPTGGTPNVVDLNDRMAPWGDVSPAQMLDHTRFYTYDA